MTRRVSSLILLIVLGAAAPASAQWTVDAFLGDAWNARGDLRLSGVDTDVTLRGLEYDDRSFDFPLYYGVRAGRSLRGSLSWLGLEVEFVHLKTISRSAQVVEASGQVSGRPIAGPVRVGDVLPRFELSHGLNFVFANVVVRRAFDGPRRVALSLRGGLGPTVPHVEATFLGRDEDAYQWSTVGWQAAGGAEVAIWGPVHVLSEVKWTGTRQDVGIGEARAEGPFRAAHLVFGIGLRSAGN